MHYIFIFAAMIFAAATPYMSVPQGRDVEINMAQRDDGAAPDRSGGEAALAAADDDGDDDAPEEA